MKKPLLTALLIMFVALSFAEKTAPPTGKKDCLPCTPYCKKHPNAPQCN